MSAHIHIWMAGKTIMIEQYGSYRKCVQYMLFILSNVQIIDMAICYLLMEHIL